MKDQRGKSGTKGYFQMAGIDKHSKPMLPLWVESPTLLEPFQSTQDITLIQQLNSSLQSMQVITKYFKLTNIYLSFKHKLCNVFQNKSSASSAAV